MIRCAKESDFDQILAMSEKFWSKTEFNEPFEPEHTENYVKMAHDQGILAVIDINSRLVGFAAGIKSPLMGNSRVFSGIELALWVDPEHQNSGLGSQLVDFIEELARKAGIKYWCMVSLQSSDPDKTNAFYVKKRYHLTEMTFMKQLF